MLQQMFPVALSEREEKKKVYFRKRVTDGGEEDGCFQQITMWTRRDVSCSTLPLWASVQASPIMN